MIHGNFTSINFFPSARVEDDENNTTIKMHIYTISFLKNVSSWTMSLFLMHAEVFVYQHGNVHFFLMYKANINFCE